LSLVHGGNAKLTERANHLGIGALHVSNNRWFHQISANISAR
jgi:hypothetical protein